MVSYKELGLVNTREMFAKAVDGGYAIPITIQHVSEHTKSIATSNQIF